VKAIIYTSGGCHANRLVGRLNYELITANPKVFVRYSEVTTLHSALVTQADLRMFYNPTSIPELGTFPGPLEFTANHLLKIMCTAAKTVGAFPRSNEWARGMPAFIVENPIYRTFLKNYHPRL
jgi:muramoyltetrapeptide carboxypeptidase LdcA involved in peptidoglycan recycling